MVPLRTASVGLILKETYEAAEVALFECGFDFAEVTAEVGEKIGEDAAIDAEAGEVDAEELCGLDDSFLGVLPIAEAAAEFFHRWGGLAFVEEFEGFSAKTVGLMQLKFNVFEHASRHFLGVGCFDEDGVTGERMALEAFERRSTGFLAVDQDLHHETVLAPEMSQDLANGSQSQRLNCEGQVIHGDRHRRSFGITHSLCIDREERNS
jgi:hypothetical protein